MTKHEREQRQRTYTTLMALGLTFAECETLRRASMTLSRWAELECGDSNNYGSWAIERDEATGVPYMVHHHYRHGQGKDTMTRTRIADRESGAIKRIAAIVTAHGLAWYHQTDPRGCAVYVLRPGDVPAGADPGSCYTRGIAVLGITRTLT